MILLLNLENDIEPDKRLIELRAIIEIKVLKEMQGINTEAELLNHIKSPPSFLVIPMVVKNHFGLK